MKKSTLLFLLLLFVEIGFAQIEFGVRSGLNVTTIDVNTNIYEGHKSLYAFCFGLYSNLKISDRWSVGVESTFNNRGYKYGYKDSPYSNWSRMQRVYLSIPILLEYRVYHQFSLFVGIETSFFLDQSSPESFSTYFTSNNSHWEVREQNKMDAGPLLGIRYNLLKYFFIDVRFTQGLIKGKSLIIGNEFTRSLLGEPGRYNHVYNEGRSRIFQFTIGYQISN